MVRGRLTPNMRSLFSMKAMRLLLALSVSVWMAGGCLFGCSNKAMGAGLEEESGNSAQTIVAGESCHAQRSHDCCGHAAKQQKPKKKIAGNAKPPKGLPTFVPAPPGMMKDCPLVVNTTAATSKSSGHLPTPGRGPVSVLPLIENKTEQSNTSLLISYVPNRGPTHLRCCVFLI